jgi:hypothetical protein
VVFPIVAVNRQNGRDFGYGKKFYVSYYYVLYAQVLICLEHKYFVNKSKLYETNLVFGNYNIWFHTIGNQ